MAKKISRRSRAARRGEIDLDADAEDPKVQSLDNVPRLEKTDVIGPLIRASVKKNRDLLSEKLKKKHKMNKAEAAAPSAVTSEVVEHRKSGKVSKAVITRRRKGVSRNGRTEAHAEANVNRRKNRKFIRGQDWATVNEKTRETLHADVQEAAAKEEEMSDVDEGVGSGWKELTGKDFAPEEKKPKPTSSKNAFNMLDEVEA